MGKIPNYDRLEAVFLHLARVMYWSHVSPLWSETPFLPRDAMQAGLISSCGVCEYTVSQKICDHIFDDKLN